MSAGEENNTFFALRQYRTKPGQREKWVKFMEEEGFDHGVGHPLLLLYDAKTPRGQKIKEFKGLGRDPSNISISLF
jgi:hypothetical protein